MKKQSLSLLLAALLLSNAALISCGSAGIDPSDSTTAPDGTTAPEETTVDPNARDKSDLPDDLDLGGYNLRLLQLTDNTGKTGATSMYLMAPAEANGEVLNDAIYARNQRATEKYDFTIELIENDNVNNEVNKSVMAGDDSYDVATPTFTAIRGSITSGIYLDLTTVPNLNLKKNYWDQNFNDSMTILGKQFFAVGDIMVAEDDDIMVLLYNRDLADDLNYENLYDRVYDGTWTYDLLRKYVKETARDVNADGKIYNDDIVGFLWAKNNTVPPHFPAAGQLMYELDKSGTPAAVKDLDKGYKIFDILAELLDQNRYSLEWTQFGSDQVSVITSLVSNKQVLFQNMVLSQVRRLYRDVTADFGILPMPKLDETQEEYHTAIYNTFEVISIPATCSNTEKVGAIIEALAAESYDINNAYYNICMQSKYTRDEESFDMIDISRRGVLYDPAYMYDWGKLYTTMINDTAAGTGNLASIIASLSTVADTEMKNFVEQVRALN